MDALGALGVFEDLQAQIKGYIGEFLSGEAKIRLYMNSPSLEISTKAGQLLGEHQALETQLGVMQGKIDNFQNGSWTMSDAIEVSNFAYNLNNHLAATRQLEAQATGVVATQAASGDMSQYYPMLGLGALGIIGIMMVTMKRRK